MEQMLRIRTSKDVMRVGLTTYIIFSVFMMSTGALDVWVYVLFDGVVVLLWLLKKALSFYSQV